MEAGNDNHQWLRLWQEQNTDFHQPEVNRFLQRFWPALPEALEHRVFVPFCGMSLDMIWLAAQGYEVVGVELSPIAVRRFFEENELEVTSEQVGAFQRLEAGRISVLCGDYFALDRSVLGTVHSVYDCTSLSALPEEIRPEYITHMRRLVEPGTRVFLLTIVDNEPGSSGPVAHEIEPEVAQLYGLSSVVRLEHCEPIQRGDRLYCNDAGTRSVFNVYTIQLH